MEDKVMSKSVVKRLQAQRGDAAQNPSPEHADIQRSPCHGMPILMGHCVLCKQPVDGLTNQDLVSAGQDPATVPTEELNQVADQNSINAAQNSSGPRTELQPTSELSAAESFTPGPWQAEVHGQNVLACDGQMMICNVRGWGYLTGVGGLDLNEAEAVEIQDANMYLIAAAPTLYAALKECVKQMRAAASLLEMFPDDYGDAINGGDWALTLANGQDTNTSAADGTTTTQG